MRVFLVDCGMWVVVVGAVEPLVGVGMCFVVHGVEWQVVVLMRHELCGDLCE